MPPTNCVNEYEDGENNTVLFKVICAGGKYFIFHKETLEDETFCDTSHMIHYVIKSYRHTRHTKVKELAGEVSNLKEPQIGSIRMNFPKTNYMIVSDHNHF